MNKLQNAQLIDSEIVPVYETDKGNKVVIAKELHSSLMASTRFNDWIQRNLLSVGFMEDTDFYSFLSKTNGRPAQDYILTLDTAKHIAMIQRTEIGMKVRQKFIDLEKAIKKPETQLEILQGTINQLVEQDKRMTELEGQVSNISNIVSINNVGWREKVNVILKKIANKWTGIEPYRSVKQLSYERFEKRAGCKLEIRLNNRKERAIAQGMTKSYVQKINKLDVIAEEKRLVEIYLQVVKEMAIEFKININDFKFEEVI